MSTVPVVPAPASAVVTPRVRSVKVVSRSTRKMSWWERVYVLALLKGMMVTLSHLWKKNVTLQYPEEKRHFRPNYRGAHVLYLDTEGRPKCVACEMCSTACPAECIHIEAAPAPWPDRERYPKVFKIDLLRCIFCGFCVEACPVDAIGMTTNIDLVSYKRSDLLWDHNQLMANQPAVRMPPVPMRVHH